MSKIESLHGTTPVEIFESGIENHAAIESIAVSVLWRDGSITNGWSTTNPAELSLMIAMLQEKLRREILISSD